MPNLPNITLNKLNGGIVRAVDSVDGVSGLLIQSATFSTSMDTTTSGLKVGVYTSAKTALAAIGYNNVSYINEVSATCSVTLATASNGEIISIGATAAPLTSFTGFGTYTFNSTDATSIANTQTSFINYINSNPHGFYATTTGVTGSVILTAPKSALLGVGTGTKINAKKFVPGSTFAAKATFTNFTGGAGDNGIVNAYQISEFFRTGGTKLYLGVKASADFASDYSEITDLVNYSGGEIRLLGIYDLGLSSYTSYSSQAAKTMIVGNLSSIQARVDALALDKKYIQVLYSTNFASTALTALPDLSQLSCPNVSVIAGGDLLNVGGSIQSNLGISCPALGACLGVAAKFRVSDCIGYIGKLQSINFATKELDQAQVSTGTSINLLTQTDLETLDNKRYTFLREFDGIAGSFISDSKTAVNPATSDFAYLELNRVVDKVRKNTYVVILPQLNSPLLTEGGKLREITRQFFIRLISTNLSNMVNVGELSAFNVNIDPNQDVVTTSQLNIGIQLAPVGVARFINVNVSFNVNPGK